MRDFWQWVVWETRQQAVPQEVLATFETGFKEALTRLIARTKDLQLKDQFIDMLDCPIVDKRGHCRKFSEYIVSALLKNGIQERFDIEEVLSYLLQHMLLDRSLRTGEPRTTVFDFDERRPYKPGENPLQARFLNWLHFAIRNVSTGKIPRLALGRPGHVPIGQGRRGESNSKEISSDAIPAREAGDVTELAEDIAILLKRREIPYGLPLVDLFKAILAGKPTREQVKQFGEQKTRLGREVIKQTIQDYAEQTGNQKLLGLLRRMNEPEPAKEAPKKLPAQERDYRSITSVIARFDHPIGLAELGRFRRRWLEYPPREKGSGYRNRLHEIMARMVRDEVLQAKKGASGATLYEPGKNFEKYRS